MALFDAYGNLIPDSQDVQLRNMQQVGQADWAKNVNGERIPPKALSGPAAEAAAQGAGRGILSRLGGAMFGPVGTGVQAALMPGDIGDGELSPEQREANNPGEQADAAAYAQRVQENARQAAQPPLQGAGLLSAGVDQSQAAQPQAAPPEAPQLTKSTGFAPTDDPQEAQARKVIAQHMQEKQRQSLEDTVVDKLKSNQLSRVKAAEAVVQADVQQRGLDLTPDEKKAAVTEEVNSMRQMNNSDLGKYLSFALMGLGAAFGATSEQNAAIFNQGFNTQYNNAINRALKQQQSAQKQAQWEAEYKLKERDTKRKEKGTDFDIDYKGDKLDLDRDKFKVDTKYKDARLGQFDRGLSQGDRRLSQGDAALGLQGQRLGLDREKFNADQAYKGTRLDQYERKLNAPPQLKAGEGTTKDNAEFVDQWSKANNVNLDTGVKESVLQQFAIARKNWPGEVAKNPDAVMKRILSQYSAKSKPETPFVPDWLGGGASTKYSIPGTGQ